MIPSMWSSVAAVLLMGSMLALAQEEKELPPVRVSSGVMAGLAESRPFPVYPPEVRAAHVNGAMVMRLLVGETGRVEDLQVISGPEMMRPAAVDAVLRWVYRPYILDGVARKVDTTVGFSQQYGGDGLKYQAPPVNLPIWLNSATNLLMSSPDLGYPADVWTARASGGVVLRVLIGEAGHVEHMEVVSGPEILRQAAMDAVRRWVYRPYMRDGVARKVDTIVVVTPQQGVLPGASTQASPAEAFCGDGRKRVSSGTMAGQLISKPDPVFGPLPAGAHVSGASVMKVCISREGTVEKVMTISGPEILRQTVNDTVSKWVYRPYLVDGKPVPVVTTVTLNILFGGG